MKKAHPTYEDIIENLTEGVISISPSMTITVFNQAAEKIFDISRQQALGRKLSDLIKRDPWFVALMETALDRGKLYSDHEERLHRSFSGALEVGVSTYRVFDNDGLLAGASALIRDLSGFKKIELEEKRKDRLSYIGTFVASLAHEVRNPLAGIRGAAQLAERRSDNDKVKKCTEIIIKESDRLNSLVTGILDFSRPRELLKISINIHKLMDRVGSLAGEDKKSLLIKEYDPSLPPVLGDEGQLTQVFLNLLKNAREASGKDGLIKVRSRIVTDFHMSSGEEGGQSKFVAIEIVDNGPGIEPKDLENIFTPFFTTKSKGSGLGLPISFQIVKEHGGFLKIDNRPDEGTQVLVYLPTAEPERDKNED